MAARCTRAADGKSRSDRVSGFRARFCTGEPGGGAAGRLARTRLCRGREHCPSLPLGRKRRATARARSPTRADERRCHPRHVFDHGRARTTGDQNDPHCIRSSCRSRRRRARREPRAARRKYHRDVDAAHRARRQGTGNFERGRASRDAGGGALESHGADPSRCCESSRKRRRKARFGSIWSPLRQSTISMGRSCR